MPFERDKLKPAIGSLAERGVFLGTSSWKYLGWRGQLYEESRYIWRGMRSGSPSNTFIYVNNRFEGNALETIAGIIELNGARIP